MNAEISIRDTVLHTERLLLRPWRQSDLEDFYAYASVDGVGQLAGWQPHGSREESQRILDKFIAGEKVFALELAGRVVGSLGVEKYDEERFPELAALRCRELGFVLAKDCWGMGLMPEAVREVLRWLFEEHGLDAVLCGNFLTNRQSARVQEKCGFRPYAAGYHTTRLGDTVEDEKRILTREDWLASQCRNTCYTYFKIVGDFDPDVITQLLDITPDKSWKAGDKRNNGTEYKFSLWNTGMCGEYDVLVEEQMRRSISALKKKTDVLNKIYKEFDVKFYLEVVPQIYPENEQAPVLSVPLDIIDFCHATHTEIDIDMYIF